jgi:uncharacterized protein YndB with AHSA1/START domain
MAAKKNPNEIRITRVYDAPVKAVWEAWTDPQQVAQWWGPRGFTITTHSKDLRPGGSWLYTMHGPDGTDYPNIASYLEVEKYARLVYDHGATKDRPPLFRVTVTFSESRGKTTMDMTMALPTAQAADETRTIIRKAGGNSTWDRLAEYLASHSTGKETFVIARTFDAPIDVVFDMWTNPRHFAQWLGPVGSTMKFLRADIRPGGTTFFAMTLPGNTTLHARAEYLAVEKPGRIIYKQQFCDEHEKSSRHPMAPLWPETMLTTVLLTEEEPGTTRVSVTWEPFGPTTPTELEAFTQMKSSMTQGWTGSFDKLENLLSTLQP